MSFETRAGNRGARTPPRFLVRFSNRLMSARLRKAGAPRAASHVVVLSVPGRKSGVLRSVPVRGFAEPDGRWLVVASYGGAADNPDWYYNVAAAPDAVTLGVDGASIPMRAEQLTGEDRAVAWRRIVAEAPNFGSYETKTDREIPVIRLSPRN